MASATLESVSERTSVSPEPDEIVVDGPHQLDLFDPGGKQPTRSTLRIDGITVAVTQGEAFKKGSHVRFTGEAVIYDTGDTDEEDAKTGIVVDCVHRQKARIKDFEIESAG